MRYILYKRFAALLSAGIVIGAGALLGGCKGDAQFSKDEMQQFKEGPPKEMPPQARKMLEEAAKAGVGGGGPQGRPGGPQGQAPAGR